MSLRRCRPRCLPKGLYENHRFNLKVNKLASNAVSIYCYICQMTINGEVKLKK
jgi:uncharacterized UBP type Zn finger protein